MCPLQKFQAIRKPAMIVKLKRLSLLGLMLLMAVPSYADPLTDYQQAMAQWTIVLETVVDDAGKIDFIGLKAAPSALNKVVAFIAKVSPATHPELFPTKDAILAYHLNAYNALAMHGVVAKDIPNDFASFLRRVLFFKFHTITIGGQQTSLYDYENDVIRPLGDARVHFALNCMVRDCPRLPKQPFSTALLQQQLNMATIEFFNKPKHLRVDNEKETIYLSEILDFYTDDFVTSGETADLITYINQFRNEAIPLHYHIEFIDYDWTVNQQ